MLGRCHKKYSLALATLYLQYWLKPIVAITQSRVSYYRGGVRNIKHGVTCVTAYDHIMLKMKEPQY